MGVNVHLNKQLVKNYRVRRVINGHRLCEVFPFTEDGFAEATALDQLWAQEQKAAALEKLKEPAMDADGFLRGLYFHVRKNKIGPDNIYLRMKLPNGNRIEEIVKSVQDVFDFIVNNLPIYKEYYSDITMSMGYYFLTAEKIFPVYKKEFTRLKKLVDQDYRKKSKEIQKALMCQQMIQGGKV